MQLPRASPAQGRGTERSATASASSSNNPPCLVRVKATLLWPAHSRPANVAAGCDKTATKLCRSPRNEVETSTCYPLEADSDD
jgi:hypothetical protein